MLAFIRVRSFVRGASTEGLSEEGCEPQCEPTSIGESELELVSQRMW